MQASRTAVRWVLLLLVGIGLFFAPLAGARPDLQVLELRWKLERLRAEYLTKKNQGYDVSAVEELVPRVRQAIRQRHLPEAARILDEMDARLRQAVLLPRAEVGRMKRPLVRGSPFGIGYGNIESCGLPRPPASAYIQTGCRLVKFADIRWQQIEPTPPKEDRHTYDWYRLDALVREWQEAGFDIQMVLKTISRWGTKRVGGGPDVAYGRYAGNVPRPGYWQDYEDFVRAVVERYDGDGREDMPGLRAPIRYYEIESEAHGPVFWQGTMEEYGRLLEAACRAARQAHPRTQVILSGINLGDLFDDGLSAREADARVARQADRLPPKQGRVMRHAYRAAKELFAFGDDFDIVEFHSLKGYRGIPETAAWIRMHLRKHGYRKPIWVGDATSGPPLFHGAMDFLPYPPEFKRYLSILNTPSDPDFDPVNRWFRAEQARLAVKKFVVSFAAGLEKVIMETEVDWPPRSQLPFHGLLNPDGSARPVTRSIALLIEKIEGFSAVKTLSSGNGVYAFEFTVQGRPVYILWCEDRRRSRPGGEEISAAVELPVPRGQKARITTVITEPGRDTPKTEVREVRAGKVQLVVTNTPIFVEPI